MPLSWSAGCSAPVRPETISIEGNIGCGKSTLIKNLIFLQPDLVKTVVPEPVEKWQPILELFYADKKRWSFVLQTVVLQHFCSPEARRAEEPQALAAGPDIHNHMLFERSPMSSIDVFATSSFIDSMMTKMERLALLAQYDVVGWQPGTVIYVDTPVDVCLERMAKRARPGEQLIDRKYMVDLHTRHECMLKHFKGRVIRIDGRQDELRVATDVLSVI